jgi:uncharacterized membrane protein YbhN (UPF0104 family)
MKENTKLILLLILAVIGVGLIIWGNFIIMRYDGFREIWKAARNAALPQLISGIVVIIIAYVLTFGKTK